MRTQHMPTGRKEHRNVRHIPEDKKELHFFGGNVAREDRYPRAFDPSYHNNRTEQRPSWILVQTPLLKPLKHIVHFDLPGRFRGAFATRAKNKLKNEKD